MTNFRRKDLDEARIQADTHPGLWLDKYLENDEEGSKDTLVHGAAGIQTSGPYRKFFEHWQKILKEMGAECREAKVLGRMAVNLGSEAVLETSIALHHTYGVPFIPGSALKGLAAHYVVLYLKNDPLWSRDGEAFVTLFGDTTSAGYVTFFDALYVPDSGYNRKALWKDVITVHHQDYYQGARPGYLDGMEAPPADWDNPVPIPFLTATGRYLIALSGPEEWVNAAFEILGLALEREGVGAKTNSGYGRMTFRPDKTGKEDTRTYATRKRALLQETPPAGRLRGTVTDVQEGGRFGKVNPARGGAKVRIHIRQITKGDKILSEGQVVEYRIGKYQGNDQAEDVFILLEPG